jgi:hypothetical protein
MNIGVDPHGRQVPTHLIAPPPATHPHPAP